MQHTQHNTYTRMHSTTHMRNTHNTTHMHNTHPAVCRSLDMVDELASKEGGEDYKTFFEAFGRNIKIGVIEDTENRERLAKLLRFHSSASGDNLTSLGEYVSR